MAQETTMVSGEGNTSLIVGDLSDPNATVEVVTLDESIVAIVKLVQDWQNLGTMGLLMALLNILIMLLKSRFANEWFKKQKPGLKRVILLALGQIMGILVSLQGGMGILESIISGLIVSGGAMAIFEAAKPLFKKKKEEDK